MTNFSKLYSSEDFVEQILSGLPPKSLMRFKCVCNLWCNLIKSPSFVAKHLSGSMRASSMPIMFKRPVLRDKDSNIKDEKKIENDDDDVETLLSSLNLCNEDDDDDYFLSNIVEDLNVPLPAPLKLKHSSDITIEGHCDGIICLKLFIGNVILCNPAMKEFKLLPKSFLLLCNDDFDLWSLSYELQYYTECLGFGYDPKGNDYKVVRIVTYREAGCWFGAEVYTMDSNSWREIKTEYDNDHTIYFVNSCPELPVYFNGICYWQVRGCHIACGEFILSFDMGNELFHEILAPDLPEGCIVRLAVWKEFIALFTYQEDIGVTESYDMWVMMNDLGDGKGSWTKHLTIGPVEGVKSSPIQFWKSDQLLLVTDDGHIVLYNIGTQILKYLPIHFKRDMIYSQALVYANSIVSINGGNVLEDIYISSFYGNGKFYSSYREDVDISAFYGNDKLEL